MRLFQFAFVGALLAAVGCTGSKHEMKEIETTIDQKGEVDGTKLGLNKDGEAVLKAEQSAADELRIQQLANSRLRDYMDRDYFELKRCNRDLSDPRLGGKGELTEMPDLSNLQSPADEIEEIGKTESGDLKVVRTQFYLDRLTAERKYEQSIRKTHKVVKAQLEQCNYTLGVARNKMGLPSERYTAQGYFTADGTWVETQKGEQSLNDALEIQARGKKKSETQAAPVPAPAN